MRTLHTREPLRSAVPDSLFFFQIGKGQHGEGDPGVVVEEVVAAPSETDEEGESAGDSDAEKIDDQGAESSE